MRSKLVDAAQSPSSTYTEGVVKYKGRVVIGSIGLLREELIKSTYDSYIGGHAGIQNTYRRLKGSLPLAFYEEISARNSSAL
jgi:hypothetical protein